MDMAGTQSFSIAYDASTGILTGTVGIDKVDKDESTEMHDTLAAELPKYPDYKHCILDVLKVTSVSSYAIGIMMKALMLVKKTRNYYILLMTDKLLQDIMLQHPEMFDYIAVFPSMSEAKKFIAGS